MKINDISENSPLCCGFVMTFIHSNRQIECPSTRNSIGNGLPMKKYVRAVVRKSSQLIIDEEIDHSENFRPAPKNTHHLFSKRPSKIKQNYIINLQQNKKTYFWRFHGSWSSMCRLSLSWTHLRQRAAGILYLSRIHKFTAV